MPDVLKFHLVVSLFRFYSFYPSLYVLFLPENLFFFQFWKSSAIIILTVSSHFPLFSTSGTLIRTILEPFHLTIISPVSLFFLLSPCASFWLNFKYYHIFSVSRSSLKFLSIELFNPKAIFFITRIYNLLLFTLIYSYLPVFYNSFLWLFSFLYLFDD